MVTRRRARECALQMLFQLDASAISSREVVRLYRECFAEGMLPDEFSISLFMKIAENLAQIDETITKSSDHWRLDRMSCVDRNILRMGIHEIISENDIPPRVAINEAVELAKRYGTAESPSFVNGILDRAARDRAKI